MYRNRSCNCNNMQNYNFSEIERINQTMENKEECDCGFEEINSFPENYIFGQSYVPLQRMNKVFTPEVGLKMGTIFPELVSTYRPGQSVEEIEFIRRTNIIGKGCNS